MRYIFGISALLIGIVGGLALPDIDLKLSFLGHRSIITHGILLPTLFFGLALLLKHSATRLLAVGISLSYAIHLSFDLFPAAWTGFALIDIPGYGRTNPYFSWFWIATNIVICMYLAFVLVSTIFDVIVTTGSLLVTFGFYAARETALLPALIALVIATGIALVLPSNGSRQLESSWRRRET